MENQNQGEFKKALTPWGLWAIAVGAVISGMYYGWNYIFASTNFTGAVVAVLIATGFYVPFMFLYAELATMIPSSAGPAAYAEKAFGRGTGFFAGVCYLMESIFATPGICISVGAYVHAMIPAIPAVVAAVGIYVIFLLINCKGIELGAVVGIIVTVVGVAGVLLFTGIAAPTFNFGYIAEMNQASFGGVGGLFKAIPYAVWFYLAIEACGMGSEETRDPKRDIPKAYIGSVFTLLVCAVLMLVAMAASLPREEIISTDAPLAVVINNIFGEGSWVSTLFIFICLFGLVASLHGIIIGQSRQAFCLARAKTLPGFLGKLDKNGTPINALVVTSVIGMVFTCIGTVDAIVVISGLGSALMGAFCCVSWLKLRKSDPDAYRPYKCKYITGVIGSVFCIIITVSSLYSALSAGIMAILGIVFYVLVIGYYAAFCRKNDGTFLVEAVEE